MVEEAYDMDEEEWPDEAEDESTNWEQWDDEHYENEETYDDEGYYTYIPEEHDFEDDAMQRWNSSMRRSMRPTWTHDDKWQT